MKTDVLKKTIKRMGRQIMYVFVILCMIFVPPFVLMYFVCGLELPETLLISIPGSIFMFLLWIWFFTEYEKSEKELVEK